MKRLATYFRPGCFLAMLGLFPCAVLAVEGQSDLSLSLGYRVDSLDWNINGENNPFGSEPNILSELEWRDLGIMLLKAEIISSNQTGFMFRGSVDYGWVQSGENQDSDYAGDNRTLEFSRSINDVDGSRVLDLSGGLGYTVFAGESEQFRISPIFGYSYHRQNLRMVNGDQRLADLANWQIYDSRTTAVPPLGPFPGLDASYEAKWSGPWLGVDVEMDLQGESTLFARLEAHKVDYSAEANWNLRSEFAHPVSFTHDANGAGGVLTLGWRRVPEPYRWLWGVTVSVQNWSTGSGIDRTYLANGAVGVGTLNEVNWSSRSINFTLTKAFSR